MRPPAVSHSRPEHRCIARAARAARAVLLLAGVGLLPGCLGAPILGLHMEPERTLALGRAEFAVRALGVAEGELFVAGARTGGDAAPGLAALLPDLTAFALRPEDETTAGLLVDLIGRERLGAVERCEIEVAWLRGPGVEQGFAGRLSVVGSLRGLCERCAVDAAAVPALLSDPVAVAVADVVDPDLRAAALAAEQMSWRVLERWAPDDSGRVLAFLMPGLCLPADAVPPREVELLVRVGPAGDGRFLRVPADLVPLLAAVERETTSLDERFAFGARLRPRPVGGMPPDLLRLPLRSEPSLVVATHDRGIRYRLDHWLLAAAADVGGVLVDVAVWVLRRCPWFAPLFREDQPQAPGGGRGGR